MPGPDIEIIDTATGTNTDDGFEAVSNSSAITRGPGVVGKRLWVGFGFLALLLASLFVVPKLFGDDDSSEASRDESNQSSSEADQELPEPALVTEFGPGAGFGTQLDWDLYMTTNGKTYRVDLETAEQTEFSGNYPYIASAGERVLVGDDGGLAMLEFGLGELNVTKVDAASQVNRFYEPNSVVLEGTDVWIFVQGTNEPDFNWQKLDLTLEKPEVVDQLPVPGVFVFNTPHPTVVSSPSGGIFEISADESSSRRADGAVRMVTSTHVLAENCVTPFDCELSWLDRQSFKVDKDVRIPPGFDDYTIPVGSSPDGRYIAYFSWTDNEDGVRIWDTQAGEMFLEFENSFNEFLQFSSDSKLVVGSTNGIMKVLNLEDRTAIRVAAVGGGESAGFIPSTAG